MITAIRIKQPATGDNPAIDLVSARQFRQDMGVSHVTVWRWIKAGHLHSTNIAGRLYLSRKELSEFQRRAEAGELRRDLPVPERPA